MVDWTDGTKGRFTQGDLGQLFYASDTQSLTFGTDGSIPIHFALDLDGGRISAGTIWVDIDAFSRSTVMASSTIKGQGKLTCRLGK